MRVEWCNEGSFLQSPKLDVEESIAGSDDEGFDEGEESGSEGEEWGGTGAAMDIDQRGSSSSNPKKAPTGEELRAIREATDLYRSGSFKLQVSSEFVEVG